MIRSTRCLYALLVAATWPAAAQTVANCPTLPADAGVEWRYTEGPDFDVCRAVESETAEPAFGLYLGHHAQFRRGSTAIIERGIVAGRNITWFRRQDGAAKTPFARQALLNIDRKRGLVAHVWLEASDEQQLAERLWILRRIAFKTP